MSIVLLIPIFFSLNPEPDSSTAKLFRELPISHTPLTQHPLAHNALFESSLQNYRRTVPHSELMLYYTTKPASIQLNGPDTGYEGD